MKLQYSEFIGYRCNRPYSSFGALYEFARGHYLSWTRQHFSNCLTSVGLLEVVNLLRPYFDKVVVNVMASTFDKASVVDHVGRPQLPFHCPHASLTLPPPPCWRQHFSSILRPRWGYRHCRGNRMGCARRLITYMCRPALVGYRDGFLLLFSAVRN